MKFSWKTKRKNAPKSSSPVDFLMAPYHDSDNNSGTIKMALEVTTKSRLTIMLCFLPAYALTMESRMWRPSWIIKDESDPTLAFNQLASDPNPRVLMSNEAFPEKEVDRFLQEMSSIDPLESELQMSFLRDSIMPIVEPLYYHHCEADHAEAIPFEEIERMCHSASTAQVRTTHHYQPWRI